GDVPDAASPHGGPAGSDAQGGRSGMPDCSGGPDRPGSPEELLPYGSDGQDTAEPPAADVEVRRLHRPRRLIGGVRCRRVQPEGSDRAGGRPIVAHSTFEMPWSTTQ